MTNEVKSLEAIGGAISEPIVTQIIALLTLHGGGLVSVIAFIASAEFIFEFVFKKKHSRVLLLVYGLIVGLIYRAYTNDLLYHFTIIRGIGTLCVGFGYGILAYAGYYKVLLPLLELIKNKFPFLTSKRKR